MHEVFDHTADIGIRIRAATLDDLFRDAALGLFSLIVTDLNSVQLREESSFAISFREAEYDYVLFDWLNELLYVFDSKRLLLSKFDVDLSPATLQAQAWGEPLDPRRHQLEHEVKAITYHGLKVVHESDGWLAEVIVDI